MEIGKASIPQSAFLGKLSHSTSILSLIFMFQSICLILDVLGGITTASLQPPLLDTINMSILITYLIYCESYLFNQMDNKLNKFKRAMRMRFTKIL